MALSNRTLSGCFDPTFASGFTDFLLVQPMVITSSNPNPAINEFRRDIRPRSESSEIDYVGTATLRCPAERSSARRCRRQNAIPSALPLRWPPSTTPAHSVLDRHSRTQRCPPPEFLRPPVPHRKPCPAPPRHPLRCDSADLAARESLLTAAFCAGWTE